MPNSFQNADWRASADFIERLHPDGGIPFHYRRDRFADLTWDTKHSLLLENVARHLGGRWDVDVFATAFKQALKLSGITPKWDWQASVEHGRSVQRAERLFQEVKASLFDDAPGIYALSAKVAAKRYEAVMAEIACRAAQKAEVVS